MKVLIAAEGFEAGDYAHTVPGELVMPAITCDRDRQRSPHACGCGRMWAGLSSRKGTTLARMVDRPDITLETLTELIADALTRSGWTDVAEWALDEAEDIADMGTVFADGTYVRRDVEQVVEA